MLLQAIPSFGMYTAAPGTQIQDHKEQRVIPDVRVSEHWPLHYVGLREV
jgi:hypothetical protein